MWNISTFKEFTSQTSWMALESIDNPDAMPNNQHIRNWRAVVIVVVAVIERSSAWLSDAKSLNLNPVVTGGVQEACVHSIHFCVTTAEIISEPSDGIY